MLKWLNYRYKKLSLYSFAPTSIEYYPETFYRQASEKCATPYCIRTATNNSPLDWRN